MALVCYPQEPLLSPIKQNEKKTFYCSAKQHKQSKLIPRNLLVSEYLCLYEAKYWEVSLASQHTYSLNLILNSINPKVLHRLTQIY